ncbi:F-box/kelch-repeat protein At3g17530 [Rosa chinensis]|uniref:F-box/kelch-repeat protein At3g17530 n=1 Tax=Rosa chinensis TaxID=74649 RepID=UPI001AD8D8AB|nr:F-box/kelch-repeat protein At3g17530 [Rosa chinensis]
MRGMDGTSARKRRNRSLSPPASNPIHHLKTSKTSSSSSAASRRPPSKLVTANIENLPEHVLVEILCRLPCYKFVSQCKSVSKRWCTLMSNPSFIGRFLCLQMERPIIRTMINAEGVEFLNKTSSLSKPLTPLFRRLMSIYSLEKEPIVVGTYNDLVLCCATEYEQRDYYIWNPCTIQWAELPPPPRVYEYTPVGFICDLPYYNSKTGDQESGDTIKLNSEYRCRVVRIIFPPDQEFSCTLGVQIFSSETGEWTESIVSPPTALRYESIDPSISFACNGMLYWMGRRRNFFIFGLDPFMVNSSKNSTSISTIGNNTIDRCKCRLIEFDNCGCEIIPCVGVHRGCLRMSEYDFVSRAVFVADLIVGEQGGWMVKCHGGTSRLCIKDMVDEDIFMCNSFTSEWSKIAEKSPIDSPFFYPFVLPWWPTPVPRLPQHAQPTGTRNLFPRTGQNAL